MTCSKCGGRTTRKRLCAQCAMFERHSHEERDETSQAETLPHECCACGHEYETDGSHGCPECGSLRKRYIGPLGASA